MKNTSWKTIEEFISDVYDNLFNKNGCVLSLDYENGIVVVVAPNNNKIKIKLRKTLWGWYAIDKSEVIGKFYRDLNRKK